MTPLSVLDYIVCPICHETLKREGGSLVCPIKHTFDVSRAGYVNLLPPGKEKNSHTGDEKAMIRARADFLSCGHYKEISSFLAALIVKNAENISSFCDMGSGEGYHTVNIAKTVHEITGNPVMAIGADASKYGAECASRLSRSAGMMSNDGIGGEDGGECSAYFIPANIFNLPVKDQSLDAAVSMFAPIPWNECRRILKPGGVLAVVSSGKEHLIEMRKIIYDEVRDADFKPCDVSDGFSVVASDSLLYTAHLSTAKEICDLFTMTPFYYKTTQEGRARLFSHSSLNITVNVNYTLFRKN